MYIGVDLGTSSVKCALADREGKILCSATEEYPLLIPREGWSEQNPEDWFNASKKVFKKLSEKADLSKVKGISFSGQMHGMVCLDEQDRVIRPALLWNDQRTVKQTDYLNNVIGEKNLIEHTGNRAVTGFTAPKVLWLKENEPENFKKVAKIMLPKDYISYMLSGVFATDVSDASGTLYFDVKNRKWSSYMLDILGIKENQLPKVYESYEAVGTVKASIAKEFGFSPDMKVIIGGGDQAVGAIGTGTVENNTASISLGTSGVVFVACEKFFDEKKGSLHSFCHANGKYHTMGVTLSAAGSLKWWSETIKEKDIRVLMDEIKDLPIDDLLFMPYLSGERSPINNPYVKGTFMGLTLMHTRANMTKSVIEGISFSLKDCLDVINKAGIDVEKARVIGGGTKSDVWLQMLANILGITVSTINTADGGALGAIILAMIGCLEYNSIEEACKKIIKEEKVFSPQENAVKIYQAKFKKYKELQGFVCGFYNKE